MDVPRPPDRAVIRREFFTQDPLDCARGLVGTPLIWNGCSGRIVETEAYRAEGDPACHTFMRRGAREFVANHPAGTAYVYLNYGVHWLFNILVKGDVDGFVLVRALQPMSGIEEMQMRRGTEDIKNLCSGPGKLSRALGIRGEHHGTDLFAAASPIFGNELPCDVIADGRIGISRAAEFPWRFTERGSAWVSVKSKAQKTKKAGQVL